MTTDAGSPAKPEMVFLSRSRLREFDIKAGEVFVIDLMSTELWSARVYRRLSSAQFGAFVKMLSVGEIYWLTPGNIEGRSIPVRPRGLRIVRGGRQGRGPAVPPLCARSLLPPGAAPPEPFYFQVRRPVLGLEVGAIVACLPGLYVKQLWPEQKDLPPDYRGVLAADLSGALAGIDPTQDLSRVVRRPAHSHLTLMK